MQTQIDLLENEEVAILELNLPPKKRETVKLITARELQLKEIPPINWIVEDLLPEGLAVLAGRPKVGKSWMALEMAISVAEGFKSMGLFNTIKHEVLYIPYEDNDRRLQWRLDKIITSEIGEIAPENFHYPEKFDFPKLNEDGLDEIENIIDENNNIKFIVIDTLGRGIADKGRKDRSMYNADYDISSRIQKLAISRNICILLIHHTRKEKADNVFDEISGTTGLTAGVDTMLVLKKEDNKHRLYVAGRDVQENEYSLEFDENNCVWRAEEKNSTVKMTVEREEIFDLIKSYGRKMRTGEITEILGKSKSNISKMLGKMVRSGSLLSVGYGTYDLKEDFKKEMIEDSEKERNDDESLFPDRG